MRNVRFPSTTIRLSSLALALLLGISAFGNRALAQRKNSSSPALLFFFETSPDSLELQFGIASAQRLLMTLDDQLELARQDVEFKTVRLAAMTKLNTTLPLAQIEDYTFAIEVKKFEIRRQEAEILAVKREIEFLQKLMDAEGTQVAANQDLSTDLNTELVTILVKIWEARRQAADIHLQSSRYEIGYFEKELKQAQYLVDRKVEPLTKTLTASENLQRAQLQRRQRQRYQTFVETTLNDAKNISKSR